MRYYTTDLYGQTLVDPSAAERLWLLRSVGPSDGEVDHPDVILTHRNGPSLIYREGGFLLRESESGELDLLRGVPVDEANRIWDMLVTEDMAALAALPWEAESDWMSE